MTNRIVAASLAVALLGGGVAYASSDGSDAEAASGDTAVETTDTSVAPETVAKAGVPAGLVEAFESYRSAVREWRHCIIDLVSGDLPAETEPSDAGATETDTTTEETAADETTTCGPAPVPADHGLGEADLLEYDLDERLATRVESKLTRIEIRTTCLAEHASEGRSAVMECVITALKAEFGDRVRPMDERRACRADQPERTGNTVAAPATGADDRGCDGKDSREVRGDRGNRGERTDRTTTGGRTGDNRSGS